MGRARKKGRYTDSVSTTKGHEATRKLIRSGLFCFVQIRFSWFNSSIHDVSYLDNVLTFQECPYGQQPGSKDN